MSKEHTATQILFLIVSHLHLWSDMAQITYLLPENFSFPPGKAVIHTWEK